MSLPGVRRRLPEERRGLPGVRRGLLKERRGLPKERRGLLRERRGLPGVRRGLPRERRGLPGVRRGLPGVRRGLPRERRGLPRERRGLPKERRGLLRERRGLPEERRGLPGERRGLPGENVFLFTKVNLIRRPTRDVMAHVLTERGPTGFLFVMMLGKGTDMCLPSIIIKVFAITIFTGSPRSLFHLPLNHKARKQAGRFRIQERWCHYWHLVFLRK